MIDSGKTWLLPHSEKIFIIPHGKEILIIQVASDSLQWNIFLRATESPRKLVFFVQVYLHKWSTYLLKIWPAVELNLMCHLVRGTRNILMHEGIIDRPWEISLIGKISLSSCRVLQACSCTPTFFYTMTYILGKMFNAPFKSFLSSSVHIRDDKHTPLFEVEWRVTLWSQGALWKAAKQKVESWTHNHLGTKMSFSGDSISWSKSDGVCTQTHLSRLLNSKVKFVFPCAFPNGLGQSLIATSTPMCHIKADWGNAALSFITWISFFKWNATDSLASVFSFLWAIFNLKKEKNNSLWFTCRNFQKLKTKKQKSKKVAASRHKNPVCIWDLVLDIFSALISLKVGVLWHNGHM